MCETALGLPRFKRDAIEKKLVVGDPEDKASVSAFGQSLLQLVPRGLELALRPFVICSIEPGVFDEDVETVEETPRARATVGIDFCSVRDNSLLRIGTSALRVSRKVT